MVNPYFNLQAQITDGHPEKASIRLRCKVATALKPFAISLVSHFDISRGVSSYIAK